MSDDPTEDPTDAPDEQPIRTFSDPLPDGVDPVQDFTIGYVAEVRSAEAAAQRSLCVIPDGDLPDDLAAALDLRVEVNLAQADGVNVTRVGSTDSEVRRMEAPFSKRRAAGSHEDDSHRRRSTPQPDSTRKEHR